MPAIGLNFLRVLRQFRQVLHHMGSRHLSGRARCDPTMLWRRWYVSPLLAHHVPPRVDVHRESRELKAYALVIAKNGPKLQESKPGDTYSNGIKTPDGLPQPQ